VIQFQGVALPRQEAYLGEPENDTLRPFARELIDDAQKPGPRILLDFSKAQFTVNSFV